MQNVSRVLGVVFALFIQAAATAGAHDEFRFVGSLVNVDAPNNRASVKFKEEGKDVTVEIKLTQKTVITRDKKKVAKAELKAGQSVVVDALGDDYDDLEAIEIRIVPPPSK